MFEPKYPLVPSAVRIARALACLVWLAAAGCGGSGDESTGDAGQDGGSTGDGGNGNGDGGHGDSGSGDGGDDGGNTGLNGGSSNGPSGCAEPAGQPALELLFPPGDAVTDAESLTVRGRIHGDHTVTAVRINGEAATLQDGDPTTFRSDGPVPLEDGDNTLEVEVDTEAGETLAQTVTVRRQLVTGGVRDVMWDATRDRAVWSTNQGLYATDEEGRTRELSERSYSALVLDAEADRLLAVGRLGLDAVDPVSGEATTLASDAVGEGPELPTFAHLVLDDEGGRVFATAVFEDQVFEIALEGGDRRVVSDADTGSGPALTTPTAIAYVPDDDTLYVALEGADRRVLSVDVETGDRAPFLDDATFSDLHYEPSQDSLIGADAVRDHVARIPLANPTVEELFSTDPGGAGGSAPAVADVEIMPGDRLLLQDGRDRSIYSTDREGQNREEVQKDRTLGEGPLLELSRRLLRVTPTRILSAGLGATPLTYVDAPGGDRCAVPDDQVDWQGVSDAVLVADGAALWLAQRGTLERFHFATGQLSLRVDGNQGTEPLINGSEPVFAYDRDDDVTYVTGDEDSAWIVRVDGDGARSAVAGTGMGTGPELENVTTLALDTARDRLLVGDEGAPALVAVDLASGDRTTLLDGTEEPRLFGLASVDVHGDTAYFVQRNAMWSLDLESEATTLISERGERGSGPLTMTRTSGVLFEPELGRAFLYADEYNALSAVDLETGDRILISR